MASFEDLSKAVIAGNDEQVKALTQAFVDGGSDLLEIINNGLVAGMDVVGARFKKGEMFVPEVLMAARSMSVGMDIIKPLMTDKDIPSAGTVLVGTVKGDLHDIGKNLLGMMMESVGFKVINLGVDIGPEQFAAAAKEHNADIIGMSALLTTTMPSMKETVDLFKEEGLGNVIIMVGGAPVSQEYADEIGAHGFAPDAATACDVAKALMAKK